VLAPPDQFSLIGRRVRGTATADGVHLWYSLRPRPGRLSPQLVARWSTENGTTRLVGEIRQDPLIALRVAMTGALLAIVLVAMAFRGAASIATALLGGVVLAGYPWIAWYMSSGGYRKDRGVPAPGARFGACAARLTRPSTRAMRAAPACVGAWGSRQGVHESASRVAQARRRLPVTRLTAAGLR